MSAKGMNKKTGRQKKLIHSVNSNRNESEGVSFDLNTLEGKEAAIARQFNLIQKDYEKLMNDVMKELVLVRSWIGTQATSKGQVIRTLFNTRLSRT